MKRAAWFTFSIVFLLFFAKESIAALPAGFDKATWGMTKQQFLSVYGIHFAPPKGADDAGVWAVEGPAPGEMTVSGASLGEADIRSVSLGFHPKWGLAIIHVRFRDTQKPGELEILLPKWAAHYGTPKEQLPGPKVVWEDAVTHVELIYHKVSPRHPTPSDHFALVLWSVPLMEKIEASEKNDQAEVPDVEKLEPLKAPHLEK